MAPTKATMSSHRKIFGKNELRWFGDPTVTPREQVVESIKRDFSLIDNPTEPLKLREPQFGAIYAIFSERTLGAKKALTIVMPTGTGKTEAMLVAFAHNPTRTMIIVPSDALREQICAKFITLGKLPEFGVAKHITLKPVVAVISSSKSSENELKKIIELSNLVITTPQAFNGLTVEQKNQIANSCERLIVDEAHHVAAKTWNAIVEFFQEKEILQFTATPYREDGKHIGGKIIYAYPLSQAQQRGFFSKINYHSVVELHDPDRALAQRAIAQLRKDIAQNFNHILMARVATKNRAKEVLELYKQLAPDLNPQRIDSDLTNSARTARLIELRTGIIRIIVCVNMLGEGFDLSELKVAAIHDPQKSLAVTLQFIGRFARTGDNTIGEASAFVPLNVAGIDDRLRQLYSEDADWNKVIRDLTETAVGRERDRSDFDKEFHSLPEEISLLSIRPKMSAVTYKSNTLTWRPDEIYNLFADKLLTTTIGINNKDKVVWWISREKSEVAWDQFGGFTEMAHHLYVVFCDDALGYLYINSSNNESLHEEIAEAIGGKNLSLLDGDQVFRVLFQVARRVPTNVGLLDAVSRNRRFSMHVGHDVLFAWKGEGGTKMKTNIFANGYSGGQPINFGASRKGRVWSHQVAKDLHEWICWAKKIGPTICDLSISIPEVMDGFLIPEQLETRPDLVPIAIELPPEFLNSSKNAKVFYVGEEVNLLNIEFKPTTFDKTSAIEFEAHDGNGFVSQIRLVFSKGVAPSFVELNKQHTIKTNKGDEPFSDFLNRVGVLITFENETLLTPGGLLLRPNRQKKLFAKENIEVHDWSGVDIRRESQGPNRASTTIQYRTLAIINAEKDWDVVIDDDGPGELADIVFMKIENDVLTIGFVHCKFSSEPQAGARISDLYEVCGQAQKMNRTKLKSELITDRLLRREKSRLKKGKSGLMKGDQALFLSIANKAKYLKKSCFVVISQPGISKTKVSEDMLALLGSTERFLLETAEMKLRVIASA
jgi:superfamily II DNA or RNA helicase